MGGGGISVSGGDELWFNWWYLLTVLCLIGMLAFNLNVFGKTNANIFTNGSPFFTPIRIPIRSVSRTIFTFTTSLFSASCVLLAKGDFTAHDSVPTFSPRG